jgi:hypothetical protein
MREKIKNMTSTKKVLISHLMKNYSFFNEAKLIEIRLFTCEIQPYNVHLGTQARESYSTQVPNFFVFMFDETPQLFTAR